MRRKAQSGRGKEPGRAPFVPVGNHPRILRCGKVASARTLGCGRGAWACPLGCSMVHGRTLSSAAGCPGVHTRVWQRCLGTHPQVQQGASRGAGSCLERTTRDKDALGAAVHRARAGARPRACLRAEKRKNAVRGPGEQDGRQGRSRGSCKARLVRCSAQGCNMGATRHGRGSAMHGSIQ